jgi:hypothetical protein
MVTASVMPRPKARIRREAYTEQGNHGCVIIGASRAAGDPKPGASTRDAMREGAGPHRSGRRSINEASPLPARRCDAVADEVPPAGVEPATRGLEGGRCAPLQGAMRPMEPRWNQHLSASSPPSRCRRSRPEGRFGRGRTACLPPPPVAVSQKVRHGAPASRSVAPAQIHQITARCHGTKPPSEHVLRTAAATSLMLRLESESDPICEPDARASSGAGMSPRPTFTTAFGL